MLGKNKFYVSSDAMIEDVRSWRKETLEEAVKHAQNLMEKDGSKEKLIVRVVAIVKRKPVPVTVTKVK